MNARSKLGEGEIKAKLASLPGWSLDQGKLHREFRFATFVEAFAFLTKVALFAEKRDHHPDLVVTWGKVDVSWTTHDAGGVTQLDVEMAEKSDSVYGEA